jgi:SAM-dependent methyltransferase
MSEEALHDALSQVRDLLADDQTLVRAVAAGRRRGGSLPAPAWRRVELRYVDLKTGRHLQVVRYDDTQAHTTNHPVGDPASEAVSGLLAEPFANWHVATTEAAYQVRVTKKGRALTHRSAASAPDPARTHDRVKARLLPADDPVLIALGVSSKDGRVKPSTQAKYRQVEDFLRLLDAAITDALTAGQLRQPTAEEPLRIVDLGCGNAYLTFAAHRYLTSIRELPVRLTGVDAKGQARERNTRLAAELDIDADFVVSSIAEVELPETPEVVLALHACDTATDEALGRAARWHAALVLAAPCCHHDIAAQLRRTEPPEPYSLLTRDGILRERFADTMTDALRAGLMRGQGYRVDVVEFVESQHTPRNTLIRAVRTGPPSTGRHLRSEYDELAAQWGITPRLAELLGP